MPVRLDEMPCWMAKAGRAMPRGTWLRRTGADIYRHMHEPAWFLGLPWCCRALLAGNGFVYHERGREVSLCSCLSCKFPMSGAVNDHPASSISAYATQFLLRKSVRWTFAMHARGEGANSTSSAQQHDESDPFFVVVKYVEPNQRGGMHGACSLRWPLQPHVEDE